MKTQIATAAAARRPAPNAFELASMLGEYAALAQHPGEDNERLALAIRVVEMLQRDARDAAAARLPQ